MTDTLSTSAAVVLALLGAWAIGPTLGRWSAQHRLARFLVGLLTELRMLPILVALVPLLAARSRLPEFAIIGLLSGASRAAAIARWTSHVEPAYRKRAAWELGAATTRASILQTTFEIALLEGLTTFFDEGRGSGLGAALARGQYLAVLPLVLLAWASTVLLERLAPRLGRPTGP